VLGIAHAPLEKVIEGTRTRGITFATYTRQADAPVVQHQIAEATLKIDSAWLQTMGAADEVEIPPEQEARWITLREHACVGSSVMPPASSEKQLTRLSRSAARAGSRIQARSSECGGTPTLRRATPCSRRTPA